MARRAQHGEARAWIEAAAKYTGDDCLPWPFRLHSSGYGMVNLGKPMKASRYVCILAHGEPGALKRHAAHRCGNSMCCNPRHIRWTTNNENQDDKRKHGTVNIGERNPAAVLSAEDVLRIREARAAGVRRIDLAARYNVHPNNIYLITKGKRWAHVKGAEA
jgi:hypothetical protein